MNKTTKNGTTTIGVLALGLLVAMLLATLLPSAPAGADVVPAGNARSWGDNTFGQLGNGDFLPGTDRAVPVRVKNLTGVKAVAAGGYHSLALLESGRVRSWGANLDGQLGNNRSGSGTERSTPGGVTGLENVRAISGGAYHSLAVLQGGGARAWDDNEYGQLGNGFSGTDKDVPVAVKNLPNVGNIDGGYEFTLAVVQ